MGKPCSALCSAVSKNIAAASCCHSLSEAVFLFTMALFGLIGANSHLHTPSFREIILNSDTAADKMTETAEKSR